MTGTHNRKHKGGKGADRHHDDQSNGSSTAHQLNRRNDGDTIPVPRTDGSVTPPQQIILNKTKRPSLKGTASYSVAAPGTPWHELAGPSDPRRTVKNVFESTPDSR